MLRPTVSWPVCLGVMHPSTRSDYYNCQTTAVLLLWGTHFHERTGLKFTIAVGLRQRSHFRTRVLRDYRPYFTVSDLRFLQPGGPGPRIYTPGTAWPSYTPRHWVPFSSPPTTCRDTVEIFDPFFNRGTDSQVESSLMLRPTVSRPVYLGIKYPSVAYDQIFITVRQLLVC
jgi:hypothetical protein